MRRFTILMLALSLGGQAWAGPAVLFDPSASVVLCDDTFELSFRAAASEDSISGFQLYLSFDPEVMELVEATEGSLYVESGHATWFRAEELAPGVWHFFDTVLGDSTCVLPPGELLHLTMTAGASGQTVAHVDTVRLADVRRNDLPVGDVSHAQVTVVPASGVDDAVGTRLWLGPPRPNPCGEGTRVAFARPLGGGCLEAGVYDVSGRLVRRLDVAPGALEGEFFWDLTTDDGVEAPSSVYFVRVSDARGTAHRAVIAVR